MTAGIAAIVPQRNQPFHDWLGTDWIVVDPSTGSAGYLLAGSLMSATVTTTGGGSSAVSVTVSDALRSAGLALARDYSIALVGDGLALAAEGGIIIAEATTAAAVVGGLVVFGVGIAMAGAALFLYYKLGGPIPFVSRRRRTIFARRGLRWQMA